VEHLGLATPMAGASGLIAWAGMSVVMMGPAAVPGISHVRQNSLRWRRGRAALEYAGGYLLLWVVAGALTLVVLRWLEVSPSGATQAVVLAAAPPWQLTPAKWGCLRACHRSVALPPRGWAAERAAIRFGALNGAACVGSCWVLMLAMALSPEMNVGLMAATTGAVAAERMGERPRRVVRWTAIALAVAAVLVGAEAWAATGSA
jgi:predicted metal-binding membrane protein